MIPARYTAYQTQSGCPRFADSTRRCPLVTHVASGLHALRLVAERADPTAPIPVGEIARGIGRPLSGTSRLCAELEALGVLERAGGYGGYRLGAGAIALSGRIAAPFARATRYALTLAAQQTGETALLATPSPRGVLVVDAVESIWTLHASAEVGEVVTDERSAVVRAVDPDGPDGDGLRESTIGMSVEIASPVTTPAGACIAVLALRIPVNRRADVGVRARRALVAARRTLENVLGDLLAAPRTRPPASPVAPGDARPSALAATLGILSHLASGPDSVAGIARATGLRPDRTRRLVDACRRAGFVTTGDEDGAVLPSWGLHGWFRASAVPIMVARGKPLVAEAAHRTATCGFITVLKGMRSFTIVEELEMAGEGLKMASWLGRAHPIVGSDGGPALVMDFTPEELRLLFPARNTPRELGQLLDRVHRTVRDGVLSMQAYEDAGIVSISAPIRDASGGVAGAACLVGTTAYMETHLAEFEAEARALAGRIAALLAPR